MFATRKNRISRSVSKAAQRSKPIFETLEERQHFSVYTVSNTNDSGAGSLRAAIQAVDAGKDSVVKFNIPKSSHGYSSSTKTWTITPLSPLPVMDKTVMIDGYSQPGYSKSPVVKINGQGLEFSAPHSTLRGMEVDGGGNGILLDSTSYGDVIVGNKAYSPWTSGIEVRSSDNTIGAVGHPNIILDSLGMGLSIDGNDNKVIANTVSTAEPAISVGGNGNVLQGNTVSGSFDGPVMIVGGTGNLIGGYSSGDGNVVYGTETGGIDASNGNEILGNSITMAPSGWGIAQDDSQPAPIVSSAMEYLGKLTVSGAVLGTPFSTVRVELFASTPQSSEFEPAINSEGQVFLGYVNVKCNDTGSATFTDTLAYGGGGEMITATATANGNTSAFSNAEATFVRLPILFPIHLI